MAITLDLEMNTPDGSLVSYGIAHLNDNSYAGVDISLSWEQSASTPLTYWCNWDDLEQFTKALTGDIEVVVDGGVSRYRRFLPHRLPVNAFKNMWCTGITSIKGIPGNDTDAATTRLPQYTASLGLRYRYAAVTAKYEPLPYPVLPDSEVDYDKEWQRFTTVQRTPRLEFIQIAAGTFYWIDSPEVARQTSLPHNVPFREQSVDYVVTFHRTPEAFFDPSDYIGYTNNADGFLAGHPQVYTSGFPKDTMLLLGVNEIILPTLFREEPYYSFQYLFQERKNTHNKVRRLRTDLTPPTFDYTGFSLDGLTPSSNSTRVFKQANMGALFLPNA